MFVAQLHTVLHFLYILQRRTIYGCEGNYIQYYMDYGSLYISLFLHETFFGLNFFLLSVCYMTRKCYIRLMHYRRQWLILARIYFSFQPKTLFDCFSNVTQNCKQTSNHLDKKCIMCRQAIAITTINKEEGKIWISNFLEKWCWITVSFNKLFLCIICVKAPYDSFGKKWEMKLI